MRIIELLLGCEMIEVERVAQALNELGSPSSVTVKMGRNREKKKRSRFSVSAQLVTYLQFQFEPSIATVVGVSHSYCVAANGHAL